MLQVAGGPIGLPWETKGKRARLYIRRRFIVKPSVHSGARSWMVIGLPEEIRVLLAANNKAFVNKGEKIMTHGGSSIEEVVVPFIKIVREG